MCEFESFRTASSTRYPLGRCSNLWDSVGLVFPDLGRLSIFRVFCVLLSVLLMGRPRSEPGVGLSTSLVSAWLCPAAGLSHRRGATNGFGEALPSVADD